MQWTDGNELLRKTLEPMTMLLIPVVLVACGSPKPATQTRVELGQTQTTHSVPRQASTDSLAARLAAVDRAVDRWSDAPTLATAHEAAEEARNLIVGESGPFYGDANRDGQIAGANVIGVLPALDGGASLASPNDNACVVADILGGSWRDPAKRWSQFQSALSRWTISRNTFPSLPSHAQRVVGWASLTLKSDSPVEARKYAKHARLHVDIALRALNSCRR